MGLTKDQKKRTPNTIAVFRNGELWARAALGVSTIHRLGEKPLHILYESVRECVKELMEDPDTREVKLEKYYDERVKK